MQLNLARFGLTLVVGVVLSGMAWARDETPRVTITEENDLFGAYTDRHYTQGAEINFLSGPVTRGGFWDTTYQNTTRFLPLFGGTDTKRKWNWHVVGQQLFTPDDTSRATPLTRDRPYGAWLFTGISLLQESRYGQTTSLENLELQGGVVGPLALGAQTQNWFHQFIGVDSARGWRNEIRNEPGIALTYERKWRIPLAITNSFGFDAIPEVGVTGGNIYTYGQVGGMIRLGRNLAADYGPYRMRPNLSGTNWFDASKLDGNFGWYVYAGAQGRAIARNIFLDGNTWRDSPSVDKRHFVGDLTGGFSLFWGQSIKADFVITQPTKEFAGQEEEDRFGGFNLSFAL